MTAFPAPPSGLIDGTLHRFAVRAYFEGVFAKLGVTPPTQSCEMLSFNAAEQVIIESNSVAMLSYSPQKLRRLRPEHRDGDHS